MGKATLIGVAVLFMSAGALQEPPKREFEPSAEKVKELQKERNAVLKSAAEVSMRLAQTARIEVSEAMVDNMALLEAELDAAETDSERLVLYKKTVDSLKELEALAKAQKEAARGTELSLLRIKAKRLEVEIRLERSKLTGLE
ncbi:hypothetical protein GC170_08195 [bacterium]|nr:hypothetical protein [bacterium]